ncbi:MAG: hypothetical protein JWN48_2239 [Myxococcaceae bacterium]|nr:hypothetical protein [Myxococcaceae bacterium]
MTAWLRGAWALTVWAVWLGPGHALVSANALRKVDHAASGSSHHPHHHSSSHHQSPSWSSLPSYTASTRRDDPWLAAMDSGPRERSYANGTHVYRGAAPRGYAAYPFADGVTGIARPWPAPVGARAPSYRYALAADLESSYLVEGVAGAALHARRDARPLPALPRLGPHRVSQRPRPGRSAAQRTGRRLARLALTKAPALGKSPACRRAVRSSDGLKSRICRLRFDRVKRIAAADKTAATTRERLVQTLDVAHAGGTRA